MDAAASQKPRIAAAIIASTGDNDRRPQPEEAGNGSRRCDAGDEEDVEPEEGSSSGEEAVKATRRMERSSSELDLELALDVEDEISDDEEEDEDDDKQVQPLSKAEAAVRDCRICHMSMDEECGGLPIDLGCSCKDDLAASHRHCAEAWFKIKGNKTCEICGSVARNVAGPSEPETTREPETTVEQWNDQVAVASSSSSSAGNNPQAEGNPTRHFWQGHRFLNLLLACMVLAFVISWLFHFNVPS